MNIYVLEDNYSQQLEIKKIINSCITSNHYEDTSLFLSAKPSEILNKIKKKVGYNIYFLDIEIKGSDDTGFELAQKIRELDPYGWLVFVTTHSEFLPLTFKQKLTALDFIDKQQDKTEFENAIEECLEIANKKKNEAVSADAFVFKNQHSDFQIPFSEILYFETTEITHKIRLVQKNKFSEFYANLNEIENIDKRLYKAHRSYVVNLSNIEKIDRANKLIYFVDGKTCLLSRTKISSLQRRLQEMRGE